MEDWIRIHFLAPRVQCDWRLISLHSPPAFAARLADIPISSLAIGAVDSPPPLERLARILRSLHGPALSILIPRLSDDAWTFAARWLLSFPRSSDLVRLTFSRQMGLGLYSPKGFPAFTPLPMLWGLPVPIEQAAFGTLLEEDTSFITKTYITAAHPTAPLPLGPPHIILGPMNLANHSCHDHASLKPDAPPGEAHISAVSYLSATDWRVSHAPREVPPMSPLTFTYSKEETLKCPDCLPPLTADTAEHESWCKLAETGPTWLTPLLAEDWVILSIVAPLSNKPPEQLPTHSVGRVRQLLIDTIPSWPQVLEALPPSWSLANIRTYFREAFGPPMGDARHLFPPSASGLEQASKSFWHTVAAYVRSLDLDLPSHRDSPKHILERYRRTGNIRIRYTDSGFRVLTLPKLEVSAPVRGLWGRNVKLTLQALKIISKVDSLSSRSLFKAPLNAAYFVHVGPLARCSHSCFACSNIIPSKEPWTTRLTDGVPRGYNRGAETRLPTPAGNLLHYSRGHSTGSAWWTRTERQTDFHGVCEFCAGANADLAIHLVDSDYARPPKDADSTSSSDSDEDWDAPPAPPIPPEPPPSISTYDPGDPIPSHRENLLGAGTYNVPFSVNLFQRNLTEALRAVYETDLSAAGFTGTNASPSSLLHSDENISDRALIHGTFVKKYKRCGPSALPVGDRARAPHWCGTPASPTLTPSPTRTVGLPRSLYTAPLRLRYE